MPQSLGKDLNGCKLRVPSKDLFNLPKSPSNIREPLFTILQASKATKTNQWEGNKNAYKRYHTNQWNYTLPILYTKDSVVTPLL